LAKRAKGRFENNSKIDRSAIPVIPEIVAYLILLILIILKYLSNFKAPSKVSVEGYYFSIPAK